MDKYTTKTTNSKGLRIVSHLMPDTPAVYIGIYVHTGSRFEDSTNAGVAHFFEHMVFKGTEKRPTPYQVFYDLEKIGAEANAMTGQEYTCYYIKVLKQNLENGFEILSDAFLHSKLDEAEVTKEREVIKEEIKMYEDDPSEYASDQLLENMYPEDQYGRNIAGTISGMDQLDGEKIRNFFNAHYFCENTVIAAAGEITHEELENLVNKYFSEYKQGKYAEPVFVDSKFTNPEVTYTRDMQQAQFRMATYSVPFTDPDKYKLSVATAVLGSGAASKLFIEVREKLALAYNIYAYNYCWSKSGTLIIDAGLKKDNVKQVEEVVLQEIKKLADGDFTDDDIIRAKELSKSSLLMNMDTTDSWGHKLGKEETIYNQITDIPMIITKIDEVTREDIIKVMTKFSQADWHKTIVQGA